MASGRGVERAARRSWRQRRRPYQLQRVNQQLPGHQQRALVRLCREAPAALPWGRAAAQRGRQAPERHDPSRAVGWLIADVGASGVAVLRSPRATMRGSGLRARSETIGPAAAMAGPIANEAASEIEARGALGGELAAAAPSSIPSGAASRAWGCKYRVRLNRNERVACLCAANGGRCAVCAGSPIASHRGQPPLPEQRKQIIRACGRPARQHCSTTRTPLRSIRKRRLRSNRRRLGHGRSFRARPI